MKKLKNLWGAEPIVEHHRRNAKSMEDRRYWQCLQDHRRTRSKGCRRHSQRSELSRVTNSRETSSKSAVDLVDVGLSNSAVVGAMIRGFIPGIEGDLK